MLLYFALTLFVSAALLFFVQPMVGKMILPRLGGTPAVWNTCMVFFQGVLLIGYAYTHTVSNWRDPRRQFLVHLGLLALPFLVLPFTLGDWTPPTEQNPVFSVLWLLLGMVGLPFFVVSTSAPLLQRWFATTGHPAARDPYFLYGASNLGSMLALLLYPLMVEPLFHVEEQAWLWTLSYGGFVILVAGCVALAWKPAPVVATVAAQPVVTETKPETAITARRTGSARRQTYTHAAAATVQVEPRVDQISWLRRARWILLAAVPSSLMLGVTTYLTTDIAAIPFFWVIPLALYLLTFILVFARWPVVWTETPHSIVLYVQPCFLMFLVLIKVANLSLPATWMEFAFHISAFFLTALMCHGELAKDRPSTRHLTEFYLLMSVGGVLGGMFNALVAPIFFTIGVIEYPIAMVLSCLCRPNLVGEFTLFPGDSNSERSTTLGQVLDYVIPGLIGAITYGLLRYGAEYTERRYLVAMPLVLVLALAMRPLRFALALAALLVAVSLYDRRTETMVFEDRGFFGFVKVRADRQGGAVYHTLIHGGINHGQQNMQPRRRRDPITYFHPTGGIGQIFDQFGWPDERLPASLVGMGVPTGPLPMNLLVDLHSEPPFCVVGLGTGTLAAHARPWQRLDIYEIDPLVRQLSIPAPGEEPIFTYVMDALERGAQLDIIMGDGRLKLREAPEKYYHIIVLDAFSSDAIPVHLLTANAVEEYLTKLVDGGLLIFNTTNRYVDINGVLAKIAEHHDLESAIYGDFYEYNERTIPDKFASDWLVMRRRATPASYSGGAPLAERLSTSRIQAQLRRRYLALEREDLINRPDLFRWYEPQVDPGRMWTDTYSNLFRVINWR